MPGVLDSLGYSPLTGDETSSVVSAGQVNASDLHEKAGIDGLLGLNFLHGYNYEIRFKEGVIRVEPA